MHPNARVIWRNMLRNEGFALVTGAAHRIGREIVLYLSKQGYNIVIHYRDSLEEAEKTMQIALDSGAASVHLIHRDLFCYEAARTLVSDAVAITGMQCWLLVNNAAVFENDSFPMATFDSMEKHMRVNFYAPWVLSQDFYQGVIESKNTSDVNVAYNFCIVNLIDKMVMDLRKDFFSYNISKKCLWFLTQIMASTMSPDVRVNAIAPGMIVKNSRQSEYHFQSIRSEAPLGSSGECEDICGALDYILKAKAVTGQLLMIDGGMHLQ